MKKIILLFLIVATGNFVSAETKNWRTQMQEFSNILRDGFPFFYSKSEFKDKKNRKSIDKLLKQLASSSHQLPVSQGKKLLGDEPLIEAARLDMSEQFQAAHKLFKAKKFDQAQKKVHQSLNRCFSCHTGHQVGPQFAKMNKEILGIASPFPFSKVVAFGALRQFDGVLKVAEQKARKSPSLDNAFLRIYLMISLRSLGHFDESLQLLKSIKVPKIQVPKKKAWRKNIQEWKANRGNTDALLKLGEDSIKKSPDNFVAHLLRTHLLHQAKDTLPKDQAGQFLELARSYKAMNIQPLEDLPLIYKLACLAKANKAKPRTSCQL